MSGTRCLNHGEYDNESASLLSTKASFEGFQKLALTSGEIATPASPIAPERESGVMFKNGTSTRDPLYALPSVLVCPTTVNGSKYNDKKVIFRNVKNFIGCNLALLFKLINIRS
jgi:hypothetical protein